MKENKEIKPDTIALSTVHTVHRLIMSCLNLDELLPRIARLSMQILNASRCSIKLIDSKRKILLPKATVDLRTKKTRLKKVKIGRWAPGKAFKYAKPIRGDKYLATPLIDEDVIGVITLYDKTDNRSFDKCDEEIMRTLAEQAAIAIKNAQLYKEQEKLTMGSINALAQIIEGRGPGIYVPKSGYLKVVQLMGQEFEMREQELKILQYAALLHDAGELMVPEKVLRKKGRLTSEEYRLIKEHPLKGAKIIKSLKSLKSVAPIIMGHHENFDGTGYPKGLKGNEIPIGARIMAVVSAFEAMIAKRPYRVALSTEKGIAEIKKNSGKQFDPKVVQAFLKVIKRKGVISLIKKELRKKG
jgi:HD-GYP domain-containing protein (c-di-GMP phosphodiesterase class II)